LALMLLRSVTEDCPSFFLKRISSPQAWHQSE
jgi:hypothetical protein